MQVSTTEDAFLWVEGRDDQEVIWELRDRYGLPRNFRVKEAGGDRQVLRAFYEEITAADRRAVGIVIDNDQPNRWQSITDRIRRTGYNYPIPKTAAPQGTIIESEDEQAPRLGIWLMPDNKTEGDLEHFVYRMILPEDSLVPFANRVLDEIEAAELNRYGHKRSKAFIYTWLAWQTEPGSTLRKALQTNILDIHLPDVTLFADWLNRLFNPQT
jgi:hypothetical protein